MFVKHSPPLQMALLLPLPACGAPCGGRLSPPVADKRIPPASLEPGKRRYWRY